MKTPEENIICECMTVSEHEIVYCVKRQGAMMVQDIVDNTGAGSSCKSCIPKLEEIITRELNKK